MMECWAVPIFPTRRHISETITSTKSKLWSMRYSRLYQVFYRTCSLVDVLVLETNHSPSLAV